MINRQLPIPLYYQVMLEIKHEIELGSLRPGDMIPTEVEIMKRYEISRATVRQAILQLVNEGYLRESKKGFLWFDGKYNYNGELVHLSEEWRGQKYFAGYTPEQFEATLSLCNMMCDKWSIPRDVITSWKYDRDYLNHRGIVSHHNLRADKTDVSKAFALERFARLLQK